MYPLLLKTFPKLMAELPPTEGPGPSVCTMVLPTGGRVRVTRNAATLKRVERSAQTAPATNAAQPTPAATQEERAAFRKRFLAMAVRQEVRESSTEHAKPATPARSGLAGRINVSRVITRPNQRPAELAEQAAQERKKSGLASRIRTGGNVAFNTSKERGTPAPAKGRFAGRITVSRSPRSEQSA